jgi:hypothetical protein
VLVLDNLNTHTKGAFYGRRSRPNAGLHCLCRLSLAHQAA